MTALAVSYQVQARISDEAPVRDKGFDHTTQGSYAVAAGVSKALGLDAGRTFNAIAIAGTPFNALRVTRTGALSHWKGLAYPSQAFTSTHAAFLAMRGVTGPPEVFEGNKGFMDSISGPFEIDWSKEDLERVVRTEVKKYNAEGHSQQSIEGVLELQAEHGFTGADVERIEIDTFNVAYNIIGGGEEGDKTLVVNKEQADHSLHYMVAVAILDGNVMPEQYADERIMADDVQTLLRKLVARPIDDYSARFPDEMVNQIRIRLRDGRVLTRDKTRLRGLPHQPHALGHGAGEVRRPVRALRRRGTARRSRRRGDRTWSRCPSTTWPGCWPGSKSRRAELRDRPTRTGLSVGYSQLLVPCEPVPAAEFMVDDGHTWPIRTRGTPHCRQSRTAKRGFNRAI